MSYKVEIVCRPEVAPAFALAGLDAVVATDAVEAAASLTALAAEPEVGVILVEDRLHDALTVEQRRALSRRSLPMVVPFPGPSWAAPTASAHEYIVELLRQAIGYRVRIA